MINFHEKAYTQKMEISQTSTAENGEVFINIIISIAVPPVLTKAHKSCGINQAVKCKFNK